MNRISLRLAASLFTSAALLPAAGQCVAASPASAAPAALAAEERLDHISVIAIGAKGPPIILIPGLGTPRSVWDGIAPALAKTHRVYLVQVNGFGGDDPGKNLSPGLLEGVVSDLDRYIAAHDLAGAAVIGHSLGGLAGLMLAKAHPADIGKLMVVDSLPFFAAIYAPPGVALTAAMVAPRAAALRDQTAASYGKPADPAAIAAQIRGLALKPASVEKVTGWATKADPRVTALGLYEDLTTDLRGDLPAIKTPITLVYPWNTERGQGKELTDAFYRTQYAAAPNIAYAPIADAAHFVMLDQPENFAEAVRAFLATP
ncbi:MAG: alpha/beta hydrolase [Sphingomonas sp.]|jgi:pimeloyl-ACP methyl ester carboxylesterase